MFIAPMKTISLLSIALSSLLFAGCATTGSVKTLTPFNSDRQVTFAVGQVFMVELPANPTTGFRWTCRPEAESVVEQVGEPVFVNGSAPVGSMGGVGMDYFKFRATKAGQQTLKLDYARPWERDVAPAQTLSYELVVVDKP